MILEDTSAGYTSEVNLSGSIHVLRASISCLIWSTLDGKEGGVLEHHYFGARAQLE